MRLVDSSDPGAVDRWEANRLLHERLVLANAVCAESELSHDPSGPLVGAALGLLRTWVRQHTPPNEGEVHPSDGLDQMVVPDGSHDVMDALQVASAVCDHVAILYTADTPREYASDSRRIAELLNDWVETKEPARAWSAQSRAAPLLADEKSDPSLSPVQRVAVSYGNGLAEIADVLSALVSAHRRRGFDPTAPSGTGPGEELDSWTGILKLGSGTIPDARLDALKHAYGRFAEQRGWLVMPPAREGSNRDPDNPFYRANAHAKFWPEDCTGILYGLGLATVDEVIRSMWVDPDTGRPASEGSQERGPAPNACLVNSDGLDKLYFGHHISQRQLGDLRKAYAQARSSQRRDSRIPEHSFQADYDGAQFMLIDPEVADMTGWSLIVDAGHSRRTQPFERMTAYQSGEYWSLITAIGERVEAWSAFVSRHARLVFLVTPDGERLQA